MDLNKDDRINFLIHSLLSNQATEKDVEELLKWADKSDDNKQKFLELRRIWLLTSQVNPRGIFNKAKYDEWNKLSGLLGEKEKKAGVPGISIFQNLIRIAAVFLFILSAGTTIAWIITSQKLQSFISLETYHQVNVPFGGKGEVILPDGSKVNLNAGSHLSYSSNFGHTSRNVVFEGEGYFEIETNPEKPFVVTASGLEIKALGTKFNVKAYPDEDEIITTLIEGIVNINGDNINLTMTPSQKVTYIKSSTQQKPAKAEQTGQIPGKTDPEKKIATAKMPVVKLANNINTEEITSWKDGIIIFNSERLGDLAVRLERRYDVSININSRELKEHRFTGTFQKETLEQILGIINLSAPIKYKIDKGVVIIDLDERRRAIFRELSSE
jgi:transmembrane sensor